MLSPTGLGSRTVEPPAGYTRVKKSCMPCKHGIHDLESAKTWENISIKVNLEYFWYFRLQDTKKSGYY